MAESKKPTDEHLVVIPDRRHKDAFVLEFFGRRYPLSKIGKAFLVACMVVGSAGGVVVTCFAIFGQKIVNVDQTNMEMIRTEMRYKDSVSQFQRDYLMAQNDSTHMFIRELQENVSLVGLVSCAQVPSDAPKWLQLKCDEVLRREQNRTKRGY